VGLYVPLLGFDLLPQILDPAVEPAPSLRGKKSGAKPIYDSAALAVALKHIWFATDQMCSKKLKAAILLWLPHDEQEYGTLSVSARHNEFLSLWRAVKFKNYFGTLFQCHNAPSNYENMTGWVYWK
jgi:hypothetical protein